MNFVKSFAYRTFHIDIDIMHWHLGLLKQAGVGVCILFFCLIDFVCAQVPDWSSTVAAILYKHCTSCHHPGGMAPMSFMTYDEAVLYGFSIQSQVNSKKMPPWPPDPNYMHFWGERVLSQVEIEAINDWVNGGMPAGNLSEAPPPPVYAAGALMVNPNDTIELPQFTIPAPQNNMFDVYHTFVIKDAFTQTKYLQEMEFLTNASVVHHIFVYHDTSNQSWLEDSLSPGPGFPGGGQGGFSDFAEYIFGWTPGSGLLKMPAGMGFEVPAGADLVFSIHYSPGSQGKIDSTKLLIKFAEGPNIRPIYAKRLMYWHKPYLLNPPFLIPANTVKEFYMRSDTFWEEISLLQIQPHSHLLCVEWEIYMVDANGDTTGLLFIPQWDFYWQLGYIYTKLMKIPVGAVIYGRAIFDNTVNNPNNPSNPPINVKAGNKTTDEMMAARISYLDYLPGDENYIIDSAFYGLPTYTPMNQPEGELIVRIAPNPASSFVYMDGYLPATHGRWALYDALGQPLKSATFGRRKGIFHQIIPADDLPDGLYLLKVYSGHSSHTTKVILKR